MSDNFEYDAAISAGDNSAADGGVTDFMVASIISNIRIQYLARCIVKVCMVLL